MQKSRIRRLLPLAALTLMLVGEAAAHAQSSLLPSPPPMAAPLLVSPQFPTAAPKAVSAAERASWTIVLHPTDFVVGDALGQLRTRRQWTTGFDEQSGVFEIALRRKAIPIPAPRCHMDYLILTIPVYYPESPKQASVRERRAVRDALVSLQAKGKGSAAVGVEAPEPLARKGDRGIGLLACNLYFAFPLSVQVSAQ